MEEKDMGGLKAFRRAAILLMSFSMVLGILVMPAYAETGRTEVAGKVYEFDKDSHYEISSAEDYALSNETDTYGNFSIEGIVSNVSTKDGVPAYEVSDGNLNLFYTYTDSILNANEDEWHLIDDKSKKIDGMSIDSNILNGAVILQTSNDRSNWVDVECLTNVFGDTPIQTDSFYSTTDVQLINGCFYRVIVVYETRIKVDPSKFLFISIDKYEYIKHAEVYEFYACSDDATTDAIDTNQTYSLGSKVRTEHFDGYAGEEAIEKSDDHYGWDLGHFFVSGYTDKVSDSDGNAVFLKNVGDQVTLWFNLEQDISALNGNSSLSITPDTAGYDQYFETPKMDFGRGTLIIKYTDYNNVSGEPTIYTNYLEANTTVGADTRVQLFEEGDYEIALDYQVTNDKLIDTIGHYRIFFKFSVRNGNCMVYPFDVTTGNELTNSSMTDNGFRLDLAKSRYLKINVKREIMTESADGLVEDTRFNGPARDGAEYTEEGIYTITVSNEYTNQFTTKRIYVGTNSIMKAYMTTGLSIPEINNLVSQGATIAEDGTITLAATSSTSEQESEIADNEPIVADEENHTNRYIWIVVIGAVLLIVGVLVAVAVKRKKKNRVFIADAVSSTDIEDGGDNK